MGPLSIVLGTFLKLCLVGGYLCVVVSGGLTAEDCTEFQQVLENEVLRIPIENFLDDPELLQKVDEKKGTTSYTLTGDDSTSVYKRKSIDAGKEVVVLSSAEDHFLSKKLKRRFVVLRKKADNTYYATYAYLRDALDDKEGNAVNINGSLWTIEWDTWDYRGPGKDRFQTFGFSNCGPSTIVPCGYNSEVGKEAGNDVEPLSVRKKWNPTSDYLNSPPEIKLTRFVTEPGFDINDNFDLYGDLEVTKGGSGRSISRGNAPNLDSDEVKPRFQPESIPAWAGGPSSGTKRKKTVQKKSSHRATAVSQTFVVTDGKRVRIQEGEGQDDEDDIGSTNVMKGKNKVGSLGEPEFRQFSSDSLDGPGISGRGAHFRRSKFKDKSYEAESKEFSQDSEFISDYDSGVDSHLRDAFSKVDEKSHNSRKKITVSQRLRQSVSFKNESETDMQSAEVIDDGGYGGATVAGYFRGGWASPKKEEAELPPKYSYTEDAAPATTNANNPVVLKVPTDFSPDEPQGAIFCGFLSAYPRDNCTEPIFFQPKPFFLETTPKVPTHGTMVELNYTFAKTGVLKYTDRWPGDVTTDDINNVTVTFEWKWEFIPDSDTVPAAGPADDLGTSGISSGSSPIESNTGFSSNQPDTQDSTNQPSSPDSVDAVAFSGLEPPSGNVSRLEDLNFGFPVDFKPDDSEGLVYTGFISLLPISNTSASFFQPEEPSIVSKEPTHGTMIDKSDNSEVNGTLEFTQYWETQENATPYDAEYGDAVYRFGWKWEFFPDSMEDSPSRRRGKQQGRNMKGRAQSMTEDEELEKAGEKTKRTGAESSAETSPASADQTTESNSDSLGSETSEDPQILNDNAAVTNEPTDVSPSSTDSTSQTETTEEPSETVMLSDKHEASEENAEISTVGPQDDSNDQSTSEASSTDSSLSDDLSTTLEPSTDSSGPDDRSASEGSTDSTTPENQSTPEASSTDSSAPEDQSTPEASSTDSTTPENQSTPEASSTDSTTPEDQSTSEADSTTSADQSTPEASSIDSTTADDQSVSTPEASSTDSSVPEDQPTSEEPTTDSNVPDNQSTSLGSSTDSSLPEDQPTSESTDALGDLSSTERPSDLPDGTLSTGSTSTVSNAPEDLSYTSTEGPSTDSGLPDVSSSGTDQSNPDEPASPPAISEQPEGNNLPSNPKGANIPEKPTSADPKGPTEPIIPKNKPVEISDIIKPPISPQPDPSKPTNFKGGVNTDAAVVAKGKTIANAISNTGFAGANAVDRVGLGAEANAVNGSKANANALTVKGGDALARSDTYGKGGAHSNAMSVTKGKAIGTALSRGTGNSSAMAFSKDSGAQADSITALGGNSRANAISGGEGDSIASSAALKGGSSLSSAVATGEGVAKSNSLAQGGGNSRAVADAQKGGDAMALSKATDGGQSHAIATSVGNGSSVSNSVSQGGGRTQADAVADQGDSVANAVQDDNNDEAFDVSMFEANLNAVSDQNFMLLSQQARGFDASGHGAQRSITWSADDGPTNPNAYLTGWKTQYLKIQPRVTFEHEDEIFYGLASCPYKESNLNEIDSAFHPDDYISYYTVFLRSWCMMNEFEKIKTLISDGALVAKDKVLSVPLESKFATEAKLTSHQLDELAMAFELDVFTHLLIEQREQPAEAVSRSPSKVPISKSCRFFVDFLLRGLDQARKLKPHYVRLTRQLILIAKVAYTKLLQDFDVLDPCHKCSEDKARNLYDRIEIMGVIEFMMKGLSPIDKSPEPCAETAFQNFFALNQGAIEIRVNTFAS